MKKVWIIASYKKERFDKINRVAFDYIKAIENTKLAIPFIIPCNTRNINYYINEFDYFIIPWWDDIDPSLYGQKINWSKNSCLENDKRLLNFIERIILKNKKLLWICKWMQLINIYFWWNLIQDIKHAYIHYNYKEQYKNIHKIKLVKNTILWNIFKKEYLKVNSIHHQAIDILWKNLIVSSYDKENNYIESIESNNWNIIWIQWHPENLEKHQKIFKYFLNY